MRFWVCSILGAVAFAVHGRSFFSPSPIFFVSGFLTIKAWVFVSSYRKSKVMKQGKGLGRDVLIWRPALGMYLEDE